MQVNDSDEIPSVNTNEVTAVKLFGLDYNMLIDKISITATASGQAGISIPQRDKMFYRNKLVIDMVRTNQQ